VAPLAAAGAAELDSLANAFSSESLASVDAAGARLGLRAVVVVAVATLRAGVVAGALEIFLAPRVDLLIPLLPRDDTLRAGAGAVAALAPAPGTASAPGTTRPIPEAGAANTVTGAGAAAGLLAAIPASFEAAGAAGAVGLGGDCICPAGGLVGGGGVTLALRVMSVEEVLREGAELDAVLLLPEPPLSRSDNKSLSPVLESHLEISALGSGAVGSGAVPLPSTTSFCKCLLYSAAALEWYFLSVCNAQQHHTTPTTQQYYNTIKQINQPTMLSNQVPYRSLLGNNTVFPEEVGSIDVTSQPHSVQL